MRIFKVFILIHLPPRENRSNASWSFFVSALSEVGADRFDAPNDESNRAKNKFNTTRLPMTTVAKKNGTQTAPDTRIQSHIDSIHSPHKTRNTIINECIKSLKFHRGISLPPKLKYKIRIKEENKKNKFLMEKQIIQRRVSLNEIEREDWVRNPQPSSPNPLSWTKI